jgi:hypothetical protein
MLTVEPDWNLVMEVNIWLWMLMQDFIDALGIFCAKRLLHVRRSSIICVVNSCVHYWVVHSVFRLSVRPAKHMWPLKLCYGSPSTYLKIPLCVAHIWEIEHFSRWRNNWILPTVFRNVILLQGFRMCEYLNQCEVSCS